ncbi:MAG: YibE/F family protein [Lachnospiraceae bacterium]|nr:YibE/F family protein [Lachnospiraceae bacterium]
MKKKLTKIILPILMLAAFIGLILWANDVEITELVNRSGQTFEKGVVTEIVKDNLQSDGSRSGQQTVKVEMLTGVRKGEILEMTSSSGYLFGAGCTVGMHVIVMQSVSGDVTVASVYVKDREWVIYIFAALYLLLLCVIGGKQGVKGCLGLIFTFVSVIFLYIPLIYRGYSPFWVAVFVCFITTLITMYLIGGATRKTICAIGGTITGILSAGITAILFSKASGITGYNVSDIESLITLWNVKGIQVGGLLFSGLLISALGATMDVAMSVSSAMYEIAKQMDAASAATAALAEAAGEPDSADMVSVESTDIHNGKNGAGEGISRKELWLAGMRVGRDMMGTDSNTLILAFVGTSTSTLVLDYAYNLPYQQLINSNNIGIAIMQGLSGSFGIVLSVPLTVTLGAILLTKKKKDNKPAGRS